MGCDKCNTTCDSNCNCVVRYTGPNIDCLGINTEDTFDTVLSKLSSYVCDINFEDGVGIQNMTYDSVTDDFEVTLTDGTVYNFTGLQGNDGQSIDHTSFTSSSLGGAASQPGATDTYTVWGDPGESINLGTFTVYNGDEVNTTNIFAAIYDSGWKQLPNHNGTFGMPPVTGFNNPFIRVIDRTVFLRGTLILPLGTDLDAGVLNDTFSTYPSSGVNLYTGNDGGFSVSGDTAIHNSPMMPAALSPDRQIALYENRIMHRGILSSEARAGTADAGQAQLTTVLHPIVINDSGQLRIVTQAGPDTTVSSITGTNYPTLNSDLKYHLIHRVTTGDPILSFDTVDYAATVTNGQLTYTGVDTGETYPFDFDGKLPEHLGGFQSLTLDCSYPIAPTTTLTDIQNAIASW